MVPMPLKLPALLLPNESFQDNGGMNGHLIEAKEASHQEHNEKKKDF